uniref:Intraflagellar transport protein 46 homolog n=1 Tax=Strongyloides papillosus TaxID=174720 RepID=A0A0N5C145_STREA
MDNNHKEADGDNLSIGSIEKETNIEDIKDILSPPPDTSKSFGIDYQESLSEFEEKERQIKSEIILEESLGKNQLNELKKELTIVQEEDSQDLSDYNKELLMDDKRTSRSGSLNIEDDDMDTRRINESIQRAPNEGTIFERDNQVDNDEIEEIVQHSYSPDYPSEPPPAYMEDDVITSSKLLKNQPKPSYYNFSKEEDSDASESNYGVLSRRQSTDSNNQSSGVQGIASAFSGITNLAKAFSGPKTEPLKEEQLYQEDEDDDDDDGILESPLEENKYNKKEEESQGKVLKMTSELSKLFEMIEDYTPPNIDIPYRLLPFIPDYAPAVGDVDPFIKIPRPDEVEDNLGLTILDEPAIEQSDPTAIRLMMSKNFKDIKNVDDNDGPVRNIPSHANKSLILNQWISNVKEIQSTKQATTVPHTKNLPDIEKLMQEWPESVEKVIKKIRLPTANLNVDLKEFVDICLAIVDIPVIDSRIRSLHIFFSLYAEFKKSQHFKNMSLSDGLSQYGDTKMHTTDRLEL